MKGERGGSEKRRGEERVRGKRGEKEEREEKEGGVRGGRLERGRGLEDS